MAIIFIYNDTLFVHFRVSFLYVMIRSLIYIVYWLQWSFGFFEVHFKLHKPIYTIDSAVTMYTSPRKTDPNVSNAPFITFCFLLSPQPLHKTILYTRNHVIIMQ